MIFVLDSSGSIEKDNFNHLKDFVKGLLHEINLQTCNFRVGALKFGSSAMIQFHLNEHDNNADLVAAVDRIGYSFGYTHIADALNVAQRQMFLPERGDREDARNIIVLLTDGKANVEAKQILQVITSPKS